MRQSSSDENARLREITDKLPEELDASVFGYNRWCYQNFRNIARLKRKIAESDSQNPDKDEATTTKLRRRSSGYSTSSSILFPAEKCLFCDKKEIKVKCEKEKKTAEASIKLAAEEINVCYVEFLMLTYVLWKLITIIITAVHIQEMKIDIQPLLIPKRLPY